MAREEAIQMLRLYEVNEYGEGELKTWYNGIDKDMREALDMAIEALSADAVQGEWIIRENGNRECSLCGHERQDGWDYFCGYCGARMKGGDTE